jgi:hypothetical protein
MKPSVTGMTKVQDKFVAQRNGVKQPDWIVCNVNWLIMRQALRDLWLELTADFGQGINVLLDDLGRKGRDLRARLSEY